MTRQAIVVFMDTPQEDECGEAIDLAGFVTNELMAEKIEAAVVRVNPEDADQFVSTEGVTIHDEDADPNDRKCHCASCDWKGRESGLGKTLWQIHHLATRLEPGEVTPVGECPDCGALAYLDDAEEG